MQAHEVHPGLKFRDEGLSQPPEYQIHQVVNDDSKTFKARHITSGNIRTFDKTKEAMRHLKTIGVVPMMHANLDYLAGEKVKIHLTMGSAIIGKVTAVRYATFDIEGTTLRFLKEIELDKSGGSSYPPHEIVKVQIVS